jgi:MOSC domain-containing protein YiiM
VATLVAGLYITPTAGAPPFSIEEALLEAGRGIVGDRYYSGVGTFSEKLKGKPGFEITLIEIEEIALFNGAHSLSLPAGAFRRNVVTRGIRLNELVGQRFMVGSAALEGVRLCEPCAHLAKVLHPNVLPAMVHRSGLRARIVAGAAIHEGDPVYAHPAI